MTGTHRAAIVPQKGGPFVVVDRATPEPGPHDILVQVKAVALNPVDHYSRDFGLPNVPFYPAIVGCDVAGIVTKVGSQVPDAPPVGSRVAALISSFYQDGSPDYGAFQEYALAQWEGIAVLPDDMSFEQGAVFPLALATALSGWTTIGIPLDTKFLPEDKQAVLVWGGSTSVGTLAIQTAKSLGFTVYTTASPNNHEYLKELGAKAVFDYKDSDVVQQILKTVEKDGVALHTAYCARGDLQPILDVLKETKGDAIAKVAHAPLLPPDAPTLENTEVKFVLPPMQKKAREEHFAKCFKVWLQKNLDSRSVVPSPRIQIEDGGLEGLNKAVDKLRDDGVSGTKIVVPI